LDWCESVLEVLEEEGVIAMIGGLDMVDLESLNGLIVDVGKVVVEFRIFKYIWFSEKGYREGVLCVDLTY